jgi:hypothetical protein
VYTYTYVLVRVFLYEILLTLFNNTSIFIYTHVHLILGSAGRICKQVPGPLSREAIKAFWMSIYTELFCKRLIVYAC